MLISGGVVLLIIAARTMTVMGVRLAIFGVVLPAAVIMAVSLTVAVRPQMQGILLTALAIGVFTVAMLLAPRLHLPARETEPDTSSPPPAPPAVEPALG
jgi:hypothetical protein